MCPLGQISADEHTPALWPDQRMRSDKSWLKPLTKVEVEWAWMLLFIQVLFSQELNGNLQKILLYNELKFGRDCFHHIMNFWADNFELIYKVTTHLQC